MAVQTFSIRPTAPVIMPGASATVAPRPSQSPQTVSTADVIRLSERLKKGPLENVGLLELVKRPDILNNPLLSPAQQQLVNSPAFQNVYRNFDLLTQRQQLACVQKVELLQAKHPRFLDTLNQVPNSRYGQGFQFYFIPEESHARWKEIPSGVRGAGGPVDYSGIVFSSPAFSLLKQDSQFRTALHYLSQGAVDAYSAVKPGQVALDAGGMFTDSSEDTFAHEMGHVLHAYFMSQQEQLEIWAIYTEARQTGNGFITDYAQTNHMEFFAEGVEAYLKQDSQGRFYERESLQQTNPRLYAFVRKLLEPGVKAPAAEPLSSAWKVASGKAQDSFQAIKKLFR